MAPHQIGTGHYGSSQTGHYSPTKSTTTQYHNRPLWPHPKQHRPLWPHNTPGHYGPVPNRPLWPRTQQATMAPYPTGHYGPNILTLLCYSNFFILLLLLLLFFMNNNLTTKANDNIRQQHAMWGVYAQALREWLGAWHREPIGGSCVSGGPTHHIQNMDRP